VGQLQVTPEQLKEQNKRLKAANRVMLAALRMAKGEMLYWIGNDWPAYSQSTNIVQIRNAIKIGKEAMKPLTPDKS